MAFAFKSDPCFLAGPRFQTGPWELRAVAAKNKSHDLIEFQLSLGGFYLRNNLPPLAACAPTFLALGVRYMKGGGVLPNNITWQTTKAWAFNDLAAKVQLWLMGWISHRAPLSAQAPSSAMVSDSRLPSLPRVNSLLFRAVSVPRLWGRRHSASPRHFRSCSRDTGVIPNPTLSPKRKMGRGFGIGVPNVPSLFPALYVEREERHSHVTKGNCTILPSALPLRKLNGVQSVSVGIILEFFFSFLKPFPQVSIFVSILPKNWDTSKNWEYCFTRGWHGIEYYVARGIKDAPSVASSFLNGHWSARSRLSFNLNVGF